jgi:phospholipase C
VLPVQEPGTRPARALPYQLGAAVVPSAGGRLDLRITNSGTASAPVAIYPYAGELPLPVHVDVVGEHVETIVPPADGHRLAVQGPNRVWVETAGSRTGAAALLAVSVTPRRNGVEIVFSHGGPAPVTVTVDALAYGSRTVRVALRPGRERSVTWPLREGWYDLAVTVAEDASFRRRVTGRVEDGRPGVSG